MNTYRDVLIWVLIFNLVIHIIMILECKPYLVAIDDCVAVDISFSTHGKDIRTLLFWVAFIFGFIPLMYYYYYHIIKPRHADIVLSCTVMLLWFMWDMFPVIALDNGIKPKNVFMFLFDTIFAGFVWVLVSLYIYKKFKNVIDDTGILLLCIANVIFLMVFFYECYIYNRKGTQHNWLVNLGDRLGVDKIISYFRLRNPFN